MTDRTQTNPQTVENTDVQEETQLMLRELKFLKRLAVVVLFLSMAALSTAAVVSMMLEIDLGSLCRAVLITGTAVCLFSLAGILILRKELHMKMKSNDWKNLILVSLIILMLVGFLLNRFSIVGITLFLWSTYKYFRLHKTEIQEYIKKTENQ